MSRAGFKLFAKAQLRGLSLKNRLVRSATCESGMTGQGKICDEMLGLYRGLAEGGVGMIITGHMAVSPRGKAIHGQVCIYDDSFIPEIVRLADIVHSRGDGCKVIAQLNYTGRQVLHDNQMADCVGPSTVPCPLLVKKPRELTVAEIKTIIGEFVYALERVKTAGFDGAQLHAAHGYLLSSFLSPYTNRRNDAYGGSVANRARMVREIVASARERLGDFPILIKLNATDDVEGGMDESNFPDLAREVASAGVDALEVSGGIWDCMARSERELGYRPMPIPESRTRISAPEKQSYYYKYVERLELDRPLMLVGGNRNVDRLEQIVNRSKVEFISLARPLVCEPDLPRRWLEGRGSPDADCMSCNSCIVDGASGQTLHCVLKRSPLKQKLVKAVAPRVWKFMIK